MVLERVRVLCGSLVEPSGEGCDHQPASRAQIPSVEPE
jgi:hypothetical protein